MVGLNLETHAQELLNIPTDYRAGYEKAIQLAPEMAYNYVAHTRVGDPLAEAMTEDLAELGPGESMRLIQAVMDQEEGSLRDAPASMREFFKDAETPPEWLDYAAFAPRNVAGKSWLGRGIWAIKPT